MKIPYYPGCTLNTVAKSFDLSARESAALLGFEMAELSQWNCCGASFPLTQDNIMGLAAPTKVLVNASKEGDQVTTLCSVCYNVLKRTNKVIRDKGDTAATIMDFIEEDYDGGVDVVHFLEVLRDTVGFDTIKEKVTRPLKKVKVGAYYGCMLLRPFEDVGIDNVESPTVFENFLKSIGAEPVDFPNKVECCGAHLAVSDETVVETLSSKVLSSAIEHGAEVVVTSCPLCQFNLEKTQNSLPEGPEKNIPILYFTQLLGFALGQSEEDLAFEENRIDVRAFLNEREALVKAEEIEAARIKEEKAAARKAAMKKAAEKAAKKAEAEAKS